MRIALMLPLEVFENDTDADCADVTCMVDAVEKDIICVKLSPFAIIALYDPARPKLKLAVAVGLTTVTTYLPAGRLKDCVNGVLFADELVAVHEPV